jgi:hypothetical protein
LEFALSTVEFTSATLYRYATVGMRQLLDNLDGDPEAARAALAAFLEAPGASGHAGRRPAVPQRYRGSSELRPVPLTAAGAYRRRREAPVEVLAGAVLWAAQWSLGLARLTRRG